MFTPNLLIEDYNKRIDRLVEYIRANSNVGVVYPKQELLNAKKIQVKIKIIHVYLYLISSVRLLSNRT